ncbi:MAG: hypothetical protein WB341_13690 [Terracidiphilus sp.]
MASPAQPLVITSSSLSPFRLRFQAYLWQYGSPGKGVVIDFRMGGEREGPKQVPGQLNGMLQTDGHAEYDLVCGLKKVHACSLANARRKHVEAIKANAKDQGPIGIVTLMDDLLAIDALTTWPLSKVCYPKVWPTRPPATLWRGGRSSSSRSNILNWNYPIASPRTSCTP